MIREILIKNSPVFKEIHLELSSGFNAFSGASGVGKSILMESILALFGQKDSNASVIEAHFDRALELEDWGIESEDETILSILKKDKTRYFINSQSLSKNRVIDITSGFVKYLGSRNAHIEDGYIRALLDSFIAQKSPDFAQALSAHAALFERTQSLEKELSALQQKEQQLEELKEFARFEIQKIESIAPESGEYDKLLAQKRLLSKAEKLGALAQLTDDFIDKADCAMQLLTLVERDSAFLQEALLELRNIVEDEKERLEDLLEIDAGALLERISQLSDIRKRYGSEEQALEYLAQKKVELQSYENLEQSKLALEKELALSRQKRDTNSQKLHDARAAFLADFEGALNALLEILHLRPSVLSLQETHDAPSGRDDVALCLKDTELKKLSAGEFSRVRLALMALEVGLREKVGVLILDEVDANLSGEESEGVAKILRMLAKSYQILAISHQPHIPTLCDRHFLVYKSKSGDNMSEIRQLDKDGQIQEIARMISGAKITKEALQFAAKALGQRAKV